MLIRTWTSLYSMAWNSWIVSLSKTFVCFACFTFLPFGVVLVTNLAVLPLLGLGAILISGDGVVLVWCDPDLCFELDEYCIVIKWGENKKWRNKRRKSCFYMQLSFHLNYLATLRFLLVGIRVFVDLVTRERDQAAQRCLVLGSSWYVPECQICDILVLLIFFVDF